MLTRGAQYGALVRRRPRAATTTTASPVWLRRPGRQPGRLRRQLLPDPAALALPRAVRRPVGRLPDQKPSALASALQKITGEIAADPERDLRAAQLDERLLHRPGDQRASPRDAHLDPPVARAAARAARARSRPSSSRPARRAARAVSGLLGRVTGRTKPKQANLDALFLVPSAAITLQTAAGLHADRRRLGLLPRGRGRGVPRRPRTTSSRCSTTTPTGPTSRCTRDDFGFTWLRGHRRPDDVDGPVHRPARREHHPRGAGLRRRACCARWSPFADAGRPHGRAGLPLQAGHLLPFAPTGPQPRDNLLEIQVRDLLDGELPMEQDLQRWLPSGAPPASDAESAQRRDHAESARPTRRRPTSRQSR